MASGVYVVVYPVTDLARAKTVFGALLGGAAPAVDTPSSVQHDLGGQRLGLDPNGHARGFPGSVGYWQVEDIDARVRELLAAGAEAHEAVKDGGGGALIASV